MAGSPESSLLDEESPSSASPVLAGAARPATHDRDAPSSSGAAGPFPGSSGGASPGGASSQGYSQAQSSSGALSSVAGVSILPQTGCLCLWDFP